MSISHASKRTKREIRFCDVSRIHKPLAEEIAAAVGRVLESGSLILGKEVRAFEHDVEQFLGVRHAIGVGTGTDALTLALIASGVRFGDEVIVPTFTYFAAVEAVRWAGATPRLIDVNEHGDIDVARFGEGITKATRACIVPSLYGRAAPINELSVLAASANVAIIEDSCQAFGAATHDGQFAGTRGTAGCFSFYPTKVLGGAGDGGMVVTDNDVVASHVRSLRAHGADAATDKYRHLRMGTNSRLDAIQAAILAVKLNHLPEAIARRREIAARYNAHLAAKHSWLERPLLGKGDTFYAYVTRCQRRDALRTHLAAMGIEAPIHFPSGAHEQPAFVETFGSSSRPMGSFPNATALCRSVLSLPCHPALKDDEISYICEAIDTFAFAFAAEEEEEERT